MGHTEKISDYEMARGDGPPPCEGVDIAGRPPKESAEPEYPVSTVSKTVEPEKKAPVKRSASAKTKEK